MLRSGSSAGAGSGGRGGGGPGRGGMLPFAHTNTCLN